MIISEADATWAADEFINYFGNFTSIAVSYTHLTLPTNREV